MLTRTEQAKNEWVEAALDAARNSAADIEPGRLQRFITEYFKPVDPEDCAEQGAVALAAMALAHLRYGARREPKHALVRVYNPTQAEHGWESPHTIVEIVNDDMPFLVDSSAMEVNRQGLSLHLLIHPLYVVRRDAAGNLVELFGPDSEVAGQRESFIHIEVDRLDEEAAHQLSERLSQALADVRLAVEDWPKMRERMQQVLTGLEAPVLSALPAEMVEETRAFLRWLLDNHFTFLGYRSQDLVQHEGQDALRVTPATGLGVLRDGASAKLSSAFAALPPAVRAYARNKDLLLLNKSNTRSTVHRPGYLDYVGIKRYDAHGEVCGEHRFIGLYTHAAYSANPFDIPVLRLKARQVMQTAGVRAGSHAAKTLEQILVDYPRDELFQIDAEQLKEVALSILHLGERQRLRLFVRRDRFERFVSCLIYAPREHYSTDLRRTWQAILMEAFQGSATEFNVHLSESALARVLITVRTTPGKLPQVDNRSIEQRLSEAARPWDDALRFALIREMGEGEGLALYRRFERAFPAAYREDFTAREAVADVRLLAQISENALGMRLYRPAVQEGDKPVLRLKLVRRDEPLTLSDSMPMLERMGLKVLQERPYRITRRLQDGAKNNPPDSTPTKVTVSGTDKPANSLRSAPDMNGVWWLHDFAFEVPSPLVIDDENTFNQLRGIFEESFARVHAGEIENDNFNRLVLEARLSADEITILRAYARYLRQINFPLTQSFVEETLAAHADITRMLVVLFKLRFDPARQAEAEVQQETLAIESALEGVANLNEDRVLRQYLALILATLRTNYWRRGENGARRSFLSFKFDPHKVPGLPEPKPLYEIFVYSARFEGVHLRGGKVARGGLRWSDRPEDFRTEVLGLVKAQMVKNAVIVPVGSKGGFVLKRATAAGDREALMKEGIACYQDYLRGLLDLTDNLIDGAVVPPAMLKRFDDDDPYLVVAADKGTATFSDLANGIAKEYGFWLNDAFASGGSVGYDHKAMGITARGAWESVKRHFRAIGIDTQRTAFTVVGIGDMSGDVFGNGMLLSKHIRLVAAFDHRHIFIDPTPDAGSSFAERERLFKMPRSSWADYNSMLISAGGGVYPRSVKRIALSSQAAAALGLEDAVDLTPSEVVTAILKAPVDLLYNGGIGTYVKASDEAHAEVGDRSNDVLRVNGKDLRCKIVAEGGNLGFTQRGRVEFAMKGGRINTDAIDNSAGVDASDHEVNIKILLGLVVEDGVLNETQRNSLLAAMTDEVGQLVLRDNYFQNQVLALTDRGGMELLDGQQRFLQFLERAHRLNRALEYLPDDVEIDARRSGGKGLTRPELAVLLAYSKMWLYDEMLASSLPDDAWVATALARYFPTPLREIYASYMQRHPLRREIISTHVINSMINRVGSTFVHQMLEASGAQAHEVIRSYLLAREVFGMVPLWQSIEALDNRVPAAVQMEMQAQLEYLVARATNWFIRSPRLRAPLETTIEHFVPGVESLFANLHRLTDQASQRQLETHAAHYIDAGVPADLARRVAAYDTVYAALDIVEVSGTSNRSVEDVASVWFGLAARFGWEWLMEKIAALEDDDYWRMRAKAALREDLAGLQRTITAQALAENADAQTAVDAWMRSHPVVVGRAGKMLEELRAGPPPDQAMLAVALREWRQWD